MNDANKNQNIPNLVVRGEQIYKQEIIDKGKENELVGQYVAIEVDTKEIFMGSTKEDVLRQASAKYPDKIFYVRRIGSLDTVSSRSYSILRNEIAI